MLKLVKGRTNTATFFILSQKKKDRKMLLIEGKHKILVKKKKTKMNVHVHTTSNVCAFFFFFCFVFLFFVIGGSTIA